MCNVFGSSVAINGLGHKDARNVVTYQLIKLRMSKEPGQRFHVTIHVPVPENGILEQFQLGQDMPNHRNWRPAMPAIPSVLDADWHLTRCCSAAALWVDKSNLAGARDRLLEQTSHKISSANHININTTHKPYRDESSPLRHHSDMSV